MRRAKSCLGLALHDDPEGQDLSGKLPGEPLVQGKGHAARFSGANCAMGGGRAEQARERRDIVRDRGDSV